MTVEIIKKMHEQKISGGYITLLRLTLGLAFLTTWWSNFMKGVFTSTGYVGTISHFLDHPNHIENPLDSIVQTFILPNAAIIAPGWMLMELVISLSLIFGVFTRLGSLLGALMSFSLLFATLGVDWLWTYVLMIIGFITCSLIGAGRWYGIDFWLKDILKDLIPENLVKLLV